MKKTQKALLWQSVVLASALVLVCLLCRMGFGRTYTAYISVTDPQSLYDLSVRQTEGGGSLLFGEPEVCEDCVELRIRPEGQGRVDAVLRDGAGEEIAFLPYQVGRFGTIYDYSSGGFTGDRVVMAALTVFFLAESLFLFLAFRNSKGPDFYSYFTIYTAGFSLFTLLTGLVLLTGTVRRLPNPHDYFMLNFYRSLCSASYSFISLTFPFIAAFSVAMIVSNIELLRHERKRFRNFAGILISLVMIGGALLAFFLYRMDFRGSETDFRIVTTAHNVYSTIYVYFECMLIGAVICGTMAAKHVPAGKVDYIVILGCGFRKDGSLPPLLKGRVDRALSFRREQQEKYGNSPVLVPSGGQGKDEVMPEAEAMRRYLLTQEVPGTQILPEMKSANTYQNMAFSKGLIGEDGRGDRVVFSTTNYHVFRSGVWAHLAGLRAEGIGSRTKWWFWPNAYVRECVGLLRNRWRQEILLLVILNLFFACLSMVL